MAKLSVLMSIYIKEKVEYADACFKSLLGQTEKADEWVVVEDGPLTEEMYSLLDRYQADNPGLIKRVPLKTNQGLGLALRAGVPECKNELIARMDTDDIAREDRFEIQLQAFYEDPELDICGSQIDEFEDNVECIVARRAVPTEHSEIREYQKKRDAFNHMTVMYKKSAVLKAGNYQSCPLMEDTFLWVRMLMSGAKAKNIDDSLVFVRIGKDMYARRGGWDYFKKYKEGRKRVYETGFISFWDYISTLSIQLIVAVAPKDIRGWIYKKKLHAKDAS